MGLMPVIYFKFISQLDDSEYQKTSDHPRFLQTTIDINRPQFLKNFNYLPHGPVSKFSCGEFA
jgi:hypothetical protein